MNKTYECMVLLDNREVKQGWEPLKEAVTGMFRKYGAEVVSARRWDERSLAYPIRGQRRGTYLLVYYRGATASNAGIRRELELSEVVLRHLTTACDEVPASAYEPEAEFDVNAIPEPGQEAAAAEEFGEVEAAEGELAEGAEEPEAVEGAGARQGDDEPGVGAQPAAAVETAEEER